jgi:hypothetical protein
VVKLWVVGVRDSVVGIATGYGLDDSGRSSSPGKVKNFLRVIQTGSGAHPVSHPMGTGGIAAGREVDHSPPTSAEVKKMWIHSPIRLYGVVLN